jgi:hypothetical protein
MTEPTKKLRKFNPDWPSAKADTKERKKQSQQDRRAKLHKLALATGYKTWYKLETALANDEFELVRKEPQPTLKK